MLFGEPSFMYEGEINFANPNKSRNFAKRNQTRKTMSTEAMTKIIADYFKTQPVLKAWLFGSFARGEETPLSDVDIPRTGGLRCGSSCCS